MDIRKKRRWCAPYVALVLLLFLSRFVDIAFLLTQ